MNIDVDGKGKKNSMTLNVDERHRLYFHSLIQSFNCFSYCSLSAINNSIIIL